MGSDTLPAFACGASEVTHRGANNALVDADARRERAVPDVLHEGPCFADGCITVAHRIGKRHLGVGRRSGGGSGVGDVAGIGVITHLGRVASGQGWGRGHRGAPWSRIQGAGSMGLPSGRTSKWRWGPVDAPVVPTCPMTSPAFTVAPAVVLMRERWA